MQCDSHGCKEWESKRDRGSIRGFALRVQARRQTAKPPLPCTGIATSSDSPGPGRCDAQHLLADGKKAEVRIATAKALERDPKNLKALAVRAEDAGHGDP